MLFLHGLGNSGSAWDDVIRALPKDIRIVSVDLIGFGQSPRPKWAVYSAKSQARSVLATLVKLRIATPLIIVGHSLGALVAIEMAKRYPLLVDNLILCSPPLYRNDPTRPLQSDNILKSMYKTAWRYPEKFARLAAIASKYKLINKVFNVTSENIDSYMAALHAMVINQTSLEDAYRLKVPTTILRGSLDPIVVSQNLSHLSKVNNKVSVRHILAGHEVRGRYVKFVVSAIYDSLDARKRARDG